MLAHLKPSFFKRSENINELCSYDLDIVTINNKYDQANINFVIGALAFPWNNASL